MDMLIRRHLWWITPIVCACVKRDPSPTSLLLDAILGKVLEAIADVVDGHPDGVTSRARRPNTGPVPHRRVRATITRMPLSTLGVRDPTPEPLAMPISSLRNWTTAEREAFDRETRLLDWAARNASRSFAARTLL